MQRKELYTWIIIAVVAIVAIGFIYLENAPASQNGPISVKFSFNSTDSLVSIYPYRSVFVPVQITNLGRSYVRDLGVGIFMNGNLSTIYNVSIPAGQTLFLNFSKQFSSPGTFVISYVADPSNLYTLQNRSQSRLQFDVAVKSASTPAPYSTLPSNSTWQKESYSSVGGYIYYTIFTNDYGLGSFQTSQIPAVSSFFNPLFNLTYSYLENLYSASATYPRASAYSLWIQSSLSPNVTNIWAQGAKLNSTNKTLNGQSIAVVTLNHNTTVCSWYSGGWLKNLAYEGNQSCISALAATPENSTPPSGYLPSINNSRLLANFSERSIVGAGYGNLLLVNSSAVYEAVTPNTNPNYVCYGLISIESNRSYCTTYLFPTASNTIGPLALISTSSFIGQKNLTVMALVNTSDVPYEAQASINLLNRFNISGATQPFISGINSSCRLNASLSCYSPYFTNGNLTLRLYNKLNQTFVLNTMACTEVGTAKFSAVNTIIPSLAYRNVTLPCFNNAKAITGVPLGLGLNINMNYTVLGSSYKATGGAYIV